MKNQKKLKTLGIIISAIRSSQLSSLQKLPSHIDNIIDAYNKNPANKLYAYILSDYFYIMYPSMRKYL